LSYVLFQMVVPDRYAGQLLKRYTHHHSPSVSAALNTHPCNYTLAKKKDCITSTYCHTHSITKGA
jgi:hypothetical protein